MRVPIRSMIASRRLAVARGEVHRMWPGAVLDIVTLTWWRGVYWPIHDRLWPPLSPAEAHPVPGRRREQRRQDRQDEGLRPRRQAVEDRRVRLHRRTDHGQHGGEHAEHDELGLDRLRRLRGRR